MVEIRRDSGQSIKPDHDKSLRFLLIAFGITASIAASVIVIAYAAVGGNPSGTPDKINRGLTLPSDTRKELGKSVNDYTEYIDRLLGNADSNEEISGQATDRPATSEADDKTSDGSETQRSKSTDEHPSEEAEKPRSKPADEPAEEKSVVQDVLDKLGELT